MVGRGGDDNSALGVHLAERPGLAAEYAEMGYQGNEGEPCVCVVLAPARNPYPEHSYDRFFGLDEEGYVDHSFGKPGFAQWRQELIQNRHDVIDYEDCDGPITVALNPTDLRVLGRISIDEAIALGEQMALEDDEFCQVRRLALFRALPASLESSETVVGRAQRRISKCRP